MPAPRQKSQAELRRQVDDWNICWPKGTHVKYHPVIGARHYVLHQTAGAAYVLSGHTAVVFLKDHLGCVALDALSPIPSATE